MIGSAVFYGGVVTTLAALVLAARPRLWRRVRTRKGALAVAAGGVLTSVGALVLPTFEARAVTPVTRLDEITPTWQFREFHSRHVAASPDDVYAAIRRVRADDILLFQTLTWIRRGGRPAPPSILNAGAERPIIDVALSGGFVLLADDSPRELVIGTIVDAPPGAPRIRTAELLRQPPPGYSVGIMNFQLTPVAGGTLVSTETRVFANGMKARRRFARYWRVIYPGSALIRRMWLRAIDRRVAD